jgi:hypothetical protein
MAFAPTRASQISCAALGCSLECGDLSPLWSAKIVPDILSRLMPSAVSRTRTVTSPSGDLYFRYLRSTPSSSGQNWIQGFPKSTLFSIGRQSHASRSGFRNLCAAFRGVRLASLECMPDNRRAAVTEASKAFAILSVIPRSLSAAASIEDF